MSNKTDNIFLVSSNAVIPFSGILAISFEQSFVTATLKSGEDLDLAPLELADVRLHKEEGLSKKDAYVAGRAARGQFLYLAWEENQTANIYRKQGNEVVRIFLRFPTRCPSKKK